jgi:hypothetical protein
MSSVVWIAVPILLAFIASFVIGIVMIIGGLKMMRLESYRWAMTASILALLPCSPVGLLGLVMGIWSLVVLNRRHVIAAFGMPRQPGSAARPLTGAEISTSRTMGHPSGAKPDASPVQRKKTNTVLWVAIVLVVVVVLAILLSPVIIALVWKTSLIPAGPNVNESVTRDTFSTSSATGQGTRPDAPAAESSWGWKLGPEGPVLTDVFGRAVLNLQPAQIAEVNKILQAAYDEYQALELQNTEQHTNDAGHIVVRIKPFPESIAKLENQLWSQLDAILDPQQQSTARLNLKLDPPELVPGTSSSDLVRPGFFGWGKDGASIEIWRVGAWYHWKTQTRGFQDSSRAPQLPEGYRRFWKEADENAVRPEKEGLEATPG